MNKQGKALTESLENKMRRLQEELEVERAMVRTRDERIEHLKRSMGDSSRKNKQMARQLNRAVSRAWGLLGCCLVLLVVATILAVGYIR